MKVSNYILVIIIMILSVTLISQNVVMNDLRKEQWLEGGDIQKEDMRDSLFVISTQLMRYEITLEMLKEEDSVAAQKFEYILTTQTE